MDFTTLTFSILLFVVYFCFVSLLVYRPNTTKIESVIPQHSFNYRDAFSSEYDPEPDTTTEVAADQPLFPQQLYLPAAVRLHNKVQPIVNELIIPPARQELYLSAVRQRRRNEVHAITNEIIIPVSASLQTGEISTQPNIPPLPQKRTVTQLRKFVKDHNLQALVKQKTGKTYSKCNQQELLKVLES